MRATATALVAALAVLGYAASARAGGVPEANGCAAPAAPVALGSALWNGWGRDVENTRYQPEPALRASDVPKLALKWSYGFQGSAVAGQPTVVDGRVFVASSAGRVYSLDALTGCTYWTYDVTTGVRTAMTLGELGAERRGAAPPVTKYTKKTRHSLTLAHLDIIKAPSAVYFGDDSGAVYALDAQHGTLLWKTQVDAHPLARIIGAPTLDGTRLYVTVDSGEQHAAMDLTYACCTFRGSVSALDMATGRVLWKTYTVAAEARPVVKNSAGVQQFAPAGAAVAVAPTIDSKRGLLYVGTAGSMTASAATPGDTPMADAVVALDLSDGQVRWTQQFTRHNAPGAAEFASSPILRTLASGKQILLAAQKSGIVYGLDPDNGGSVLWQTKVTEGRVPAGIEWGPAADHRSLYVALSGLAAEPENTAGALASLDMKTGAVRWYTDAPAPACSWGAQGCSHAEAQAVSVIPGIAFSGSMDGHLRAYSTINGKIVWDYETAKDFLTINQIKASGGSLDQGGATIVNGVVYINSGYGQRIGQPGNALLAFSVDGK